jgi:hypothetical protein
MKKLIPVLVASALALAAGAALAGYKVTDVVAIQPASNHMSGSVADTRAASNSPVSPFIGCAVQGYSTGSQAMYCSGRDNSGNLFFCSSSVASMVATAATIHGDSKIDVQTDASGNCTSLTVQDYSFNSPLQP